MMRPMLKTVAVAVAALLLFAARPAEAQSKSWTAVKGSVTPQAAIVIGANLDPIRKSTTYGQLLKMLQDNEPDAKQAFDAIKQHCSIDVPTAISDVTVVMKADEKPLVAIGLNGLNEGSVLACLEKVGTAMTGATTPLRLTVKKKGKVTEYSMPGERKKLYIAWLAPDVLAFTDDPNNKGKLDKMLAGKAAKGELGKMLGKVTTTSAIWAAVSKKEKEDGMTILGGYGQVDVNGATVNILGHLVMLNGADATKATTMANAGLGEAKQQAASKPAVAKVLDTIRVVANGREIDFTAAVPDKDIMQLVADFDTLF